MKKINENLSAYATGNYSQAPEYTGALFPIDAETVQGKDRLNCETPEGLHRINNFINASFKRETLNPQYEVAILKSKLNHINLDFTFDNTKPLDPINNFEVSRGDVFGVTPQTDLSKGFDRGDDLSKYNLEIRVLKTENGFRLEGKMTPNYVKEVYEKIKRNKRISLVKEMMDNKRRRSSEYTNFPQSSQVARQESDDPAAHSSGIFNSPSSEFRSPAQHSVTPIQSKPEVGKPQPGNQLKLTSHMASVQDAIRNNLYDLSPEEHKIALNLHSQLSSYSPSSYERLAQHLINSGIPRQHPHINHLMSIKDQWTDHNLAEYE